MRVRKKKNSFITSSRSFSQNQQIGVGQNLISAVSKVFLAQLPGGFVQLKPNLRQLTSRSAEALLTFSNPCDDSGSARGWKGGKKLPWNTCWDEKAPFILRAHARLAFDFGGKVAVPARATQAQRLSVKGAADGCSSEPGTNSGLAEADAM